MNERNLIPDFLITLMWIGLALSFFASLLRGKLKKQAM